MLATAARSTGGRLVRPSAAARALKGRQEPARNRRTDGNQRAPARRENVPRASHQECRDSRRPTVDTSAQAARVELRGLEPLTPTLPGAGAPPELRYSPTVHACRGMRQIASIDISDATRRRARCRPFFHSRPRNCLGVKILCRPHAQGFEFAMQRRPLHPDKGGSTRNIAAEAVDLRH